MLLRLIVGSLRYDGIARVPAGFQMHLDTTSRLEWKFLFGINDRPEMRFLERTLDANSVFLDIGAHIGFFSLFAAQVLRVKRVEAFEALPRNQALFEENRELNRLENVVLHRCAISDHDGVIEFYVPIAEPSHGALFPGGELGGRWHGASTKPIEAQVRSVDSVLGKHSSDVTAVKLDIEGFELEALRGMRELLVASRPWVLVEVNRILLELRGIDPRQIFDLMRDLGFDAYKLAGGTGDIKPVDLAELGPYDNVVFAHPTRVRELENVVRS